MEYIEMLEKYLGTRRDVSKNVYKIMNTGYRAVENGRTTWEKFLKQIGGMYNGK